MNPKLGWALAVAAIALGYFQYGWKGVVLALSVTVFWLLLQFSRAMRAMRAAGGAPIGRVASAVMLHTRLRKGQRLMEVIQFTRSLGQKLGDAPETYHWQDESGAAVTVVLQQGLVTGWTLSRQADAGHGGNPGGPPVPGT